MASRRCLVGLRRESRRLHEWSHWSRESERLHYHRVPGVYSHLDAIRCLGVLRSGAHEGRLLGLEPQYGGAFAGVGETECTASLAIPPQQPPRFEVSAEWTQFIASYSSRLTGESAEEGAVPRRTICGHDVEHSRR